MAYLFDTNAISETLRRRPNPEYLGWLSSVPAEQQFTSLLVVAELLAGAYGSPSPGKWLERIENEVLAAITVLDFDYACAHQFGKLRAYLRGLGRPIGDVDTQIAATALTFDLVLVTANSKHFNQVPGLTTRAFQPGEGSY
ncbi:MAG: ribonuclease VapC [Candidatus Xenobia bacterium]